MAVSKDPQNTSASKPLSAVARLAVVGVVGGAIMAAMAVPVVAAFGKASEVAGEQIGALPAELATPPLPNRTYMLDADGNRIATLFEENRVSVPLSQISENMQRAIIAVEDERFYEHKGVDVQGLIRAQLENTASGSIQQGASTLTMQYVRNVLVTAAADEEQVEAAVEQTTARKLQEIRYAVQVERELTKDEILNRYLNIAYFGSGAYGVEAASRRYFGHSAKKLTTAEAATLAGIVQSPVGYDPLVNPEDSETRRNAVLTKMESLDYITPEQYQKAVGKPIGSYLNPKKISNGCAESKYPFYCDYAVKQILNDPNYGKTTQDREDFLKRGGLVIRTAMQPKAQAAATNAVMNTIPPKDPSKKGAAIAMVNPPTGEVVALAQNRLWGTKGKGKTTYNYAVDQKDGGTTGMQAGSTFKIFTIAAAMEAGFSPYTVLDSSDDKNFAAGPWGCTDGNYFGSYTVSNSTSSGDFNMLQGTAFSVNTYFVGLEQQVGLCRTVDIAKRTGMTLANGADLPIVQSFTLGSVEVSPLALATSYATMANHGVYCKPHAITRIIDEKSSGKKVVSKIEPECQQAVSREVADSVTAVLTHVVDGGIAGRTGAAMSLGRDTTGKTGTTDTSAAVWYAGYTPELSTAVWVGDPRGGFKYPMKNVYINGNYYGQVFGSSLPGPIWKQAMLGALADTPPSSFELQPLFGLRTARGGGTILPPSYTPAPAPGIATPTPTYTP
ncbi:MAG: transglycosylase domain-containing protein [Actinobacteria bacterium]|nr:transglycosylase domain-containing protein [Actinomycetota bacterium]MCB8997949.1 transglycosylase domain-containing protein [Actinomycetota bacterium]MCB9414454.1 transglycosylase domain-containing protein [Actinomycetota bacterium]HRY08714.1 transglycosylase domain-containing protein [Candidatus Nanopelagicales bacterium]